MAEYSEKNKLQLTAPNLNASFSLLNMYRKQMKRLQNGLQMDKRNEACSEGGRNASNSQELSAVTIMRMAEMVLKSQSTCSNTGDFSNIAK